MSKILVFCIDALCSLDLAAMEALPHLGWVLKSGAHVVHAEPVYPSLTYPCHVSILTGTYVRRHGIPHNEKVKAGLLDQPWYNQRSDVRGATLLDLARAHGRSTCAISWPVTGGAAFDLNMPMIVPIGYNGPNPRQFLENNATPALLDRYYDRYAHHLIGEERSLDRYTMALALDILQDYPQPDIMLVKMCDLDSARHIHGVDSEAARQQLARHDAEFGQLVEAVKAHGCFDDTHFVILGDHGQTDVSHAVNLNVLLRQNGFLQLDAAGRVTDFTAWAHSASLSGWVQLKDPQDRRGAARVHAFLRELAQDPGLGIGYVFTRQEVDDRFQLAGPFDFILEGEAGVSFNSRPTGDAVTGPAEYSGYRQLRASHGGLPWKDETTTFLACGPQIRPGVRLERCSIVDIAPTLAALLGFEMPGVDGAPLVDMIGTQEL